MGMTQDIRILIVDDHDLVREALVAKLSQQKGFLIVGQAAGSDEAVEKAAAAQPDVLLTDVDMPGLNCFDAARRIATLCPQVRTIFLSGYEHDRYVDLALKAGARGYLTKDEPPETIAAAIVEVAEGGAYFSQSIRGRVVVERGGLRLVDRRDSPLAGLTFRELETMRYIAAGLAKKEIAASMGVSVKTVERHASNLMAKLDVHDRVELARLAIREGLTNP